MYINLFAKITLHQRWIPIWITSSSYEGPSNNKIHYSSALLTTHIGCGIAWFHHRFVWFIWTAAIRRFDADNYPGLRYKIASGSVAHELLAASDPSLVTTTFICACKEFNLPTLTASSHHLELCSVNYNGGLVECGTANKPASGPTHHQQCTAAPVDVPQHSQLSEISISIFDATTVCKFPYEMPRHPKYIP